jgi:hypothetical protein
VKDEQKGLSMHNTAIESQILVDDDIDTMVDAIVDSRR